MNIYGVNTAPQKCVYRPSSRPAASPDAATGYENPASAASPMVAAEASSSRDRENERNLGCHGDLRRFARSAHTFRRLAQTDPIPGASGPFCALVTSFSPNSARTRLKIHAFQRGDHERRERHERQSAKIMSVYPCPSAAIFVSSFSSVFRVFVVPSDLVAAHGRAKHFVDSMPSHLWELMDQVLHFPETLWLSASERWSAGRDSEA